MYLVSLSKLIVLHILMLINCIMMHNQYIDATGQVICRGKWTFR